MEKVATQSANFPISAEPPQTASFGIVGGGLGALVTYVLLRFRGVSVEDILIFSPDSSPEQSWSWLARSIGLKTLRSESVGHIFPTDSPGLATLEAIHQKSLWPIFKSWFNAYRPTVEVFIEHVRSIAGQTGFYRSMMHVTVGNIVRDGDRFLILDSENKVVARVRHVFLAVGHGKKNIPKPIADFRNQYGDDDRVVMAFEEKVYAPETVLVVGDGITAATEWEHVLHAGGAVAALSRDVFGQPLNAPLRYFSARGLKPFWQQAENQRVAELKTATRGTVPSYMSWRMKFKESTKSGRLGMAQGNLVAIYPHESGQLACMIQFVGTQQVEMVLVDRVIVATGFMPAITHPLLEKLIVTHDLPVVDGFLVLDDDCCISQLSQPGSILAVVGQAAVWAVPSADSLVGMKLAARRAIKHMLGPEDTSWKGFWFNLGRQWQLVVGKELV